MNRIHAYAAVLLLLLGPATAASAQAADAVLSLAELAKPGRVLVLRHAIAPGVGDPGHFVLGDCSTQRNLDAAGRAQAAELGRRLARAGITPARVYSSQWCRSLDTARLLGLGPVEELPALNSFFARPQNREPQMSALRAFLAQLPADGRPVVLVTHQVVISALAGRSPGSGGGVILALDGTREPRVLGELGAN
ncbi:MAG: histidine phosphatase family protein [Burkholderiales bacterium]|nr:histidine phosphatase family protein [Burkholderiales bacterium]